MQSFVGLSAISYPTLQIIVRLVKLIKKYKEKKKTSKNEALDFVLINLSGRYLSQEAKNEVMRWGSYRIIEKKIPNLDLNNPTTYMETVVSFCGGTIEELIKKDRIINNLLAGNYIIIPSHKISIAMTFIAMLHGITGDFPFMTFSYKTGMMHSLIKPYDIENLRMNFHGIQKTKIVSENQEQEFVLINLSGRYLSQEAKNEVMRWSKCRVIEKMIPNLDLNNPTTYMENVVDFCTSTIKDLMDNDEIINNLLFGNYIIIPSNKISIAMVFNVLLHGITGRFPFMTFSYKTGMIFNLIRPFDFFFLREKFHDIS